MKQINSWNKTDDKNLKRKVNGKVETFTLCADWNDSLPSLMFCFVLFFTVKEQRNILLLVGFGLKCTLGMKTGWWMATLFYRLGTRLLFQLQTSNQNMNHHATLLEQARWRPLQSVGIHYSRRADDSSLFFFFAFLNSHRDDFPTTSPVKFGWCHQSYFFFFEYFSNCARRYCTHRRMRAQLIWRHQKRWVRY